jgi:hypothetical protein
LEGEIPNEYWAIELDDEIVGNLIDNPELLEV